MVVEFMEPEKDEKYVGGGDCYDEPDANLLNKYRSETQNHARRIKDLITLAQESRIRIDALLGKRTRARSDLDDNYISTSNIKSGSVGYESDEWSSRRESYDSIGDRRTSRDLDRLSGRDSRESRDSDRDVTYGLSDRDRRQRRDYDRRDSRDSYESEHYKTDQIITLNSGMVEVGGVTLSNKEFQMNQTEHKPKTIVVGASTTHGNASIRASTNPSAKIIPAKPPATKEPPATKPPLNVTKKPVLKPTLAKSPFKFGTVSIQVKLDD